MELACLDLEGVLVPEVWINVAERTGIEALRLTTRDIPDYDRLMRHRLALLDQHHLKLTDIQRVIAEMGPLEGANEFLNWLREHFQLVILSDTFYEFAMPLMRQLGWPTLFCHRLEVVGDQIINYALRQADSKRQAVRAFHGLMHSEFVTTLFAWVAAHPGWMSFAIFIAATAESLTIVGVIIPGALIMFSLGALIGSGMSISGPPTGGPPGGPSSATRSASGSAGFSISGSGGFGRSPDTRR
jgi:phosphoserine/homoserine phosphotransferase